MKFYLAAMRRFLLAITYKLIKASKEALVMEVFPSNHSDKQFFSLKARGKKSEIFQVSHDPDRVI